MIARLRRHHQLRAVRRPLRIRLARIAGIQDLAIAGAVDSDQPQLAPGGMAVLAGIEHVPAVRRQARRHIGRALQLRQRHAVAGRDLMAIDDRRLDLAAGRRIAVRGIDQEPPGRIDLAAMDVVVGPLLRQRAHRPIQRHLAEPDALVAVARLPEDDGARNPAPRRTSRSRARWRSSILAARCHPPAPATAATSARDCRRSTRRAAGRATSAHPTPRSRGTGDAGMVQAIRNESWKYRYQTK